MRIKFIKVDEVTKTGIIRAAKERGTIASKTSGGPKRTVRKVKSKNPNVELQVTDQPANRNLPGYEGRGSALILRKNRRTGKERTRVVWSRDPNRPKGSRPPKPENSSTELFGNKIVEGFNNLLNRK